MTLVSLSASPHPRRDAPTFSPHGGKLFQMDDEEDLYGETRTTDGKLGTEGLIRMITVFYNDLH
jgi:hypothetical protein